MSTKIRTQLSKKNPYYLSNDRRLELMHFCLQYNEWKSIYHSMNGDPQSPSLREIRSTDISDPTGEYVTRREECLSKMKIVEDAAKAADPDLAEYILKAVTEDLSFVQLKARLEIPCGKDMYYDRYRRFFWLLDKIRK